jgi:hypothetical protein
MAKSKQPESKLPIIYGSYQWKTCRQIMEVIRITDVYMFRYIESYTNKNQTLSLSLDNFERAVKFGNLVKIS